MTTADRPITVALAELPSPERHLHQLADAAMQLLKDNTPAAAFLLADRLCRVMVPLNADALALRATAAQALGAHAAMMADLTDAVALTPRHGVANLLALRFGAMPDRTAAALRLQHADPETPHLRLAVSHLQGEGDRLLVAVGADEREIHGWAVWPAGQGARLQIHWTGMEPETDENPGHLPGGTVLSLMPDPCHPLASPGRQATTIRLAWPETAIGATVSGDCGDDVEAGAAHCVIDGKALVRPVQPRLPPPLSGGKVAPQPGGAVAIIIPVHGNFTATEACFAMLLQGRAHQAGASPPWRIIVVDDASPDAEIRALLERLSARGDILLCRNDTNLGFAASVNRGLARVQPDEDVLLLNADALLRPEAIQRLQRQAHAAPDIGTVTPFSNNGEYTSVPRRFQVNPLPSATDVARLDDAAARANPGVAETMPNGIGFCLYIRRDALAAAGGALSLAFGRGYHEDVDLCLTIAKAGYRNVCAADVYVGHAGAASFGGEKRRLVLDNLERLKSRHPHYARQSARFVRADPLAPAVARWRWEALQSAMPFVLLLTPAGRTWPLEGTGRTDVEMVRASVIADADHAALLIHDAPDSQAAGLRLEDGDHEPAGTAIRRAIATLPISAITLLDPHELPECLLDIVGTARLPFDVLASRPHPLPRICKEKARLMEATTPSLAIWLRSRTGRREIGCVAAGGVPVLHRSLGAVAPASRQLLLVPETGDLSATEHATALAWAVRRAMPDPEVEIAFLGESTDDIALGREAGVFVTGRMASDEILPFVRRLGVRVAGSQVSGMPRVAFVSPYGLMGNGAARRAALDLQAAGCRVASVQRNGEPDRIGHPLPASQAPDQIASTLALWLAHSHQIGETEKRAGIHAQTLDALRPRLGQGQRERVRKA